MGPFMIDILGYGTFALAVCALTYWHNDRAIRAASRSAEIAEARAEMWEKRHTTEVDSADRLLLRCVELEGKVTDLNSKLHVSLHAVEKVKVLTDKLIVAGAALSEMEGRLAKADRAAADATRDANEADAHAAELAEKLAAFERVRGPRGTFVKRAA